MIGLQVQISEIKRTKCIFLTQNAIHSFRLFWCELRSFGDIIRRDLSKIMNTFGAKSAKKMTQLLQMIHDLVVSSRDYFLCTEPRCITTQNEAGLCS